MTEQEVIERLKLHREEFRFDHGWDITTVEALGVAIQALEQTQLADGDRAVSLNAVINIVSDMRDLCRQDVLQDTLKQLKQLPSVNPQEPKTGHWIEEDMFDGDIAYRCSECNELFWIESGTPKDNDYNYCPSCGAKMIEPQAESEDKE